MNKTLKFMLPTIFSLLIVSGVFLLSQQSFISNEDKNKNSIDINLDTTGLPEIMIINPEKDFLYFINQIKEQEGVIDG